MKVLACLLVIYHEFIAIHSLSGHLLYNKLLAEYPAVFQSKVQEFTWGCIATQRRQVEDFDLKPLNNEMASIEALLRFTYVPQSIPKSMTNFTNHLCSDFYRNH